METDSRPEVQRLGLGSGGGGSHSLHYYYVNCPGIEILSSKLYVKLSKSGEGDTRAAFLYSPCYHYNSELLESRERKLSFIWGGKSLGFYPPSKPLIVQGVHIANT